MYGGGADILYNQTCVEQPPQPLPLINDQESQLNISYTMYVTSDLTFVQFYMLFCIVCPLINQLMPDVYSNL